MANKTILSTVYNNQELLWKITSGLNVKSNAISGAVSGILDDYASLKGTTAGIATTLLDLSENTQKAIDALSATDTGVIDTRITTAKTALTETIDAVSTVLDGKIITVDGKVDTLSGQVVDAFGEGAKVVVSKDGGITKSEAIIGGATLADTALSTTLATEAAVRNAIDTKSISLVGHEAIGVSGGLDKTAYLKIDANDKVLTQSDDGLKTTIGLSAITPTSAVYAKSYCLVGTDGQQLGDVVIDIPKDQHLSGMIYDPVTQKLTICYYIVDGTVTSTVIDLSGLVDIYTAASGVKKLEGTNTFVGVVDGNSESYLTVGEDGFKLAGVNDAINAASAYAYTEAATSAINYTDTQIAKVNTGAAALSGRVKVLEDTLSGTDGVIAQLAAEITNRETAVSTARTDLSAYVEAASGNISTALAAEVTNRETAVSTARTDLSAYVDAVSGNISTALATEVTNRETAISTARTDLSAYVEAASGNAYAYTDSSITNISATISTNYVTKEVFGDIASNIKADNELLANKYETLQTELNTLLGKI